MIAAEPPMTSSRCVEQLLGLAEAGHDVAAQDQVGVGVADDEHARAPSVGGHGSHPGGSIASICPEPITI